MKPKGELTITEQKVIEVVKNHPETQEIFKSLFPEVFIKQKIFCKIGCLLKRDKYPHITYALFKWNREVRLFQEDFIKLVEHKNKAMKWASR